MKTGMRELRAVEQMSYKGLNKEIDTSLQVEISDNTYSITLMFFI